jgi:hypothetical protein
VGIAFLVAAALDNVFGDIGQPSFDRTQIIEIDFTRIFFFAFHLGMTSLLIGI